MNNQPSSGLPKTKTTTSPIINNYRQLQLQQQQPSSVLKMNNNNNNISNNRTNFTNANNNSGHLMSHDKNAIYTNKPINNNKNIPTSMIRISDRLQY